MENYMKTIAKTLLLGMLVSSLSVSASETYYQRFMKVKQQAGADYSQLLSKTCMGDDKKVDVKCMQDHYAAFVKAYGQVLADHFYIPAFKPAGK